jgi:DNA-binding CsgD family transcriptional regulator
MLICETSDENALRRAVDGDPYTRAGLVARLRVLQWTVELGAALTAEEPGRRRGDALIRMIESGPRIDPAAVAARGRGLTAHERRIAKLILAGATNREIADRFRVSARAVELHITNIYRKLGISRRAQLAGALVA